MITHYTDRACFLAGQEGCESSILHLVADGTSSLIAAMASLQGSILQIYGSTQLSNSDIDHLLGLMTERVDTLVIWGGEFDYSNVLQEIGTSIPSRDLRVVFVYRDHREAWIGEQVRNNLLEPECHRAAHALRHRPNTVFARLGSEGPAWFRDLPEFLLPLPQPLVVSDDRLDNGSILLCSLPESSRWSDLQTNLLRLVLDRKLLVSNAIQRERLPEGTDFVDIMGLNAAQPFMVVSDLVVDLDDTPGGGSAARTALALGRPFLTTWRPPQSLQKPAGIDSMFTEPWFEAEELEPKLLAIRQALGRRDWPTKLAEFRSAYGRMAEARWGELCQG